MNACIYIYILLVTLTFYIKKGVRKVILLRLTAVSSNFNPSMRKRIKVQTQMCAFILFGNLTTPQKNSKCDLNS